MRITEKVELFNRAFPLAWRQITPPQNEEKARELSIRLADIIRASINAGLDDPQAIADAAVALLKE
jgi:hypothetical protein